MSAITLQNPFVQLEEVVVIPAISLLNDKHVMVESGKLVGNIGHAMFKSTARKIAGGPTPAIEVSVLRINKNVRLEEICSSLAPSPKDLCLSQEQIEAICKNRKKMLVGSFRLNFFLFLRCGHPVVFYVGLDHETRQINKVEFDDLNRCDLGGSLVGHHLFVPTSGLTL
jgi:hypothetical protein